ncbi:MAG: hypothetical protein RLY86_2484 [Pseudomonadota bacterium]|jgi:putative colanic acid biosynthesis glycosyltransferase
MTPTVSIITVVKDDPAGLDRTAASILGQSLREQDVASVEWLVADGGSGPATRTVLARLGRHIDWLDSRPDAGPFDGMNRAMAAARGEWLLFLNAGDTFHDSASLALLVGAAGQAPPEVVMVFGDTAEDAGDGRDRIRPARNSAHAPFGMFAHHCAILYRHRAVAHLRYRLHYEVAADYCFTLEALAGGDWTINLRQPVARFSSGGLSRRMHRLGRIEQQRIRQETLCMPLSVCLAIRGTQSVAEKLRRFLPKFYARLRFTTTLQP